MTGASNNSCRLAIAPVSRGVGFAVFEGKTKLLDWGVKSVAGDKNAESLAKVKALIRQYGPETIVIQDLSVKGTRRAQRIHDLCDKVIHLAKDRGLKVKLVTYEAIARAFFGNRRGTKHERARIIAERFPEELASRLPPKRKPWNSEDYRMDIFDAVALGLV